MFTKWTVGGIMKDNRKRKTKHRKSKHCTGGIQVKYTKAERLDIGRQVYDGEMTTLEAVAKFGVGRTSIENYIRAYRISNGLPARGNGIKKPTGRCSSAYTLPSCHRFFFDRTNGHVRLLFFHQKAGVLLYYVKFEVAADASTLSTAFP